MRPIEHSKPKYRHSSYYIPVDLFIYDGHSFSIFEFQLLTAWAFQDFLNLQIITFDLAGL